jgi:flavodoxin
MQSRNIGIIVHSHTGNTLSVANKLREALLAAGKTVCIERVTAVNEDPSAAADIGLRDIPDTAPYDALIFAAPVRGFSLSPVMKLYLSQLPSLKGTKTGLFVTQHFPKAWMGGNRAIEQMKQACLSKNAEIVKTGVINWSNKQREEQIRNLIDELKISMGG